MRTILHIVFFLCISNALSQAVGYIYEELPENSISNRTVRTHSSLKPEIRITPKDPQKTSFTGLADMNVGIDSSFAFRSGIGFDFTSLPGKGWFIRLAGVQGFGNQENLLAPRSILRFDDPDGYLYTDIRSRISYIPNQIFNFQVGVDHNF
jgi:hypothetical protein